MTRLYLFYIVNIFYFIFFFLRLLDFFLAHSSIGALVAGEYISDSWRLVGDVMNVSGDSRQWGKNASRQTMQPRVLSLSFFFPNKIGSLYIFAESTRFSLVAECGLLDRFTAKKLLEDHHSRRCYRISKSKRIAKEIKLCIATN